ncbi:hypothetical protein ACQPZP_05140 [Spirillospora sp. CA-142024]|uniref:hypothetical protein n=1 Tax=Spirillospora sp. CA-142024 TaxID=3240036 RepID=UPI003D8C3402
MLETERRQSVLSEGERRVYNDAVASGISAQELDDFLANRIEPLMLYDYVVARESATRQEVREILRIVAGFRHRDRVGVLHRYCGVRELEDGTRQEAIEIAHRRDLCDWGYLTVRAHGESPEGAKELFVHLFDAREYQQVQFWAGAFTGTAPSRQMIIEVLGAAGDYTKVEGNTTKHSQPGLRYGRLLGTGASHRQALEILGAARFDGVEFEDYYKYRGFSGDSVAGDPWRMLPGGPYERTPLGHDAALRNCGKR